MSETATNTTETGGQVHPMVMPIMLPYGKERDYPDAPKTVPFSMLSESRAQHVHSQTLKRLSERGGMAPSEMLALMTDQNWFDGNINGIPFRGMDIQFAIEEIKRRLEAAKRQSRCYPH